MTDKKLHKITGILIALVGMALVTFIPHDHMYGWDRGAVFGLVLIVDAGIDVGLTSDYLGNIVPCNGAPDIGAYEYGSIPVLSGNGPFGKDRNGNFQIDKNGVIMIIQ